MFEITKEQREVIEELRRRTIKDVTPTMLEDKYLFYRFCKARDFNVSDAEEMLRKHIAWRKELQIDSILTNFDPPEVVKKYLPTNFLCFDKEGFPVRYTDVGNMDMKGLWNSVNPLDAFKYLIQMLQNDEKLMHQQSEKLGKPVTKFLFIHNFENFKFSNATHRKSLEFVRDLLKAFIDNFPERQRGFIIINASVYFTWLYTFVKPILPASIIQTTRVYASEGWKEELRNLIDLDDLPAFLGGNKTDPNGDPLCKSFLTHGEPVPERYFRCNNKRKLSLLSEAEKLVVRPLSKEEVSIPIHQIGSLLQWEFEIKDRDIEFSVLFKNETQEELRTIELIPKQRMNTYYGPEKDYIKCENVGIYTIVFDNSYSWLHSKEIYHRITVSEPTDGDNL